MWPESSENQQPLRTGLTTGTCATACCIAAGRLLLTQESLTSVEVTLPKGKVVTLEMKACELVGEEQAHASTIKDAGDDPDVTHGAEIFVDLKLVARPGVHFVPGKGVGQVTREGLVINVGEPAINPVPRKMMTEHLEHLAVFAEYSGGFEVSVGVVNGEQIALKTMNPRLGIEGGLSILGTTGIVRPYSCAAYIASIHQGIEVAKTNGVSHIAATTGSTSEAVVEARYALEPMALIEMGDFVGAVLKHLRKHPVSALTICGGFGKISKLAKSNMDLNSRACSIDFAYLRSLAEELGAPEELLVKIESANTSMQVVSMCHDAGIDMGDRVCGDALEVCRTVIGKGAGLGDGSAESSAESLGVSSDESSNNCVEGIEVIATDRKGNIIGRAAESEFSIEPLGHNSHVSGDAHE